MALAHINAELKVKKIALLKWRVVFGVIRQFTTPESIVNECSLAHKLNTLVCRKPSIKCCAMGELACERRRISGCRFSPPKIGSCVKVHTSDHE